MLLAFLGSGHLVSAQAGQTIQANTEQRSCGFDEMHQRLMRTDAGYNQRVHAFNELAQHAAPLDDRDINTSKVPVVVHVMDLGTAATAVTDDQIRAMIKRTNEYWRKVAGSPGAGTGVDMNIEFVLAVRDPQGNCTSGITRTSMTWNAAYVNYGVAYQGGLGMPDADLKAYQKWDQTKYYNIWLVGEIDNGGPNDGYALFASAHGSPSDGTVLLAGRTTGSALAHELGHAFNLFHTFEGDANGTTCPPSGTCALIGATTGDLCCDTPPHIRPSSCNPAGTNTCDGNSLNSLHLYNYMNYTPCADNMFTFDQKTRAQLAMTNVRGSYLAANGNMSLVPPSAPQLDFRASATLLCGTGQTVTMEDLSYCLPNTYLSDAAFPGITYAWSITNGIITLNSAAQRPTFTLTSPGTYNATLTVTTSLGTFVRTENGVVVVGNVPVTACTPQSSSQCPCGHTVSRVVFNTINNNTDAMNNVAYTDFACTWNTILAAGGTYPLSVTINSGSSPAGTSLNGYIDWNNNGTFEEPGERVIQGSTTSFNTTAVNTSVTVPGGAVTNTLLRMRLYGESGTLTADKRNCLAPFVYGDVEDYGVYVSSVVASVTIGAAPGTTITYGTNVTFTPVPVNGGASPAYTWLRNGTPVATGATYQSNTLMPGETIRCEMASNLAGVLASPALSNTLTMTVTGPPLSEFSAAPRAICPGGTVSFTDASTLLPTSWSWTFPGGTPASSTSQNPVVTYNTPGTYNVTLVASNANGAGTNMTKTGYVTVLALPAAACTHTRTASVCCGIGITNVTLNTINNTTVYNGAVMNDYICSQRTALLAGTPYPISVTGSTQEGSIQWLRVYIDYNNNGLFTDAGELIFSPADGLGTRNGTFTTPASPVLNTLLRMRVISDVVTLTPGPCVNLLRGQSEDYGVYFTPPPCTAPAATTTTTCAGAQFNVGVNLTSMGSATSIAIQVDNDAGGPNGYTTVQTVTATGNYGPFGPYASGSAVNVRLVHNGSATCNLDLNNVVTTCTGPGSTCTYSSTTTSNIADNSTVTNTITVPALGGQVITDLDVFVYITHPNSADLRLSLLSPTGTSIALINTGVCGTNDNLTVEFDQQAPSAIGAVCPMTNIYAIPAASLAGFNTQVMQGTWTLSVQDVATSNTGVLNSWCLMPTLALPCVAPTATATTLCAGTQYSVSVNLTSMGSATSIAIQVDNDAGGPNGYSTVQFVTGTGNYGPFGPYASGSAVNVRLVHNLDAGCNVVINNVVTTCNGPGSTCTYSSTTPTNIVDNTTVTNTITVPALGGQTITDLDVFVNITHSWVADLRLTLQSPTGTSIALINTGLCGGADNMTVEFDQLAPTAIGVVCPMINLYAIPAASLAGFNGQVMQGAWTLSVQDVGNGDAGILNGWCLMPVLAPPPCTAPNANATATCAGAQYGVNVNLTSMGSATSIAIQVDNDAGGPNGYTTVQTVTATGNYGPFGTYASGSPVNVRLVHNVSATCNLDLNNVVTTCNGPGTACAYSSTTTSPILDNTTATNSITVPALGGQTVTDLNVFVNMAHTYVSDLILTLQSPSGTTITLMAQGSCGDFDDMTVEFNQQATTAIGVACPMTNIFAIPSTSLAAFNGQLMQGSWTLSVQDAVGGDEGTLNSWCLIPTLGAAGVQVSAKAVLEGPYNATTGIMSDALRSASLVPATQPYTALGYTFIGSPGAGSTLGAGVLAVTGNNAIVDWMVVELRNTASPTTVVASCAALLQRDADVVALDGTSPVAFAVAAGNYYVALRHRNHLAVMTQAAIALSASPATVDFRLVGTGTYGTNARKSITGTIPAQALWAGDVTFNGELKYTGASNDRDPILVTVGSTTPNNTVGGYSTRDTNLDGVVKYAGPSNDRDPILVNVGSTTPNNTRLQQLP